MINFCQGSKTCCIHQRGLGGVLRQANTMTAWLVLLAGLFFALSIDAQTASSTEGVVLGAVTDSSGAAVPGANGDAVRRVALMAPEDDDKRQRRPIPVSRVIGRRLHADRDSHGHGTRRHEAASMFHWDSPRRSTCRWRWKFGYADSRSGLCHLDNRDLRLQQHHDQHGNAGTSDSARVTLTFGPSLSQSPAIGGNQDGCGRQRCADAARLYRVRARHFGRGRRRY